MRAIYIASIEGFSGKSILTISLAHFAKENGMRIGYFKPMSTGCIPGPKGELVDEDTETMGEILGSGAVACPVKLHKNFLDELKNSRIVENILESYRSISSGKDLMLIEGASTLSIGSIWGCHVPKLASLLNAELFLVIRYGEDFVIDQVLQARDYCRHWGIEISGLVLNRVVEDRIGRVRGLVKPLFEKEGLRVLGIMPEDRVLSSLTVREINEALGGEVIAGKRGLDNLVETFLIGAMTPESAINYFRRVKNELIITGGDRTDIVLAALEAGASALILTGNLYPSVKVLPRADELGIPLIVVPQDTYTTLQNVQKIVGKIKPRDNVRIESALKLVRNNVDWKAILQL
ncbi:MAG: phosphotransacetylase family protein [Candidatus Brockarchaeota archaeon]|nr:phosphotransacetylase family protein [Candidatus Brockarchaeota archaeon]